MRRASIALALLLVPAALVACGGDDERLSAQEFKSQANAICQNLNVELQNKTTQLLAKDSNALSTVDKVAKYFIDIALPVAREKLDKLDELKPPKADQAEFDDLIDEGRTAVDDVEDGLKDDPASIMSEGPNPLADFDDLAREIGLSGCAAPQRPSERQDASSTTTTTTKEP